MHLKKTFHSASHCLVASSFLSRDVSFHFAYCFYGTFLLLFPSCFVSAFLTSLTYMSRLYCYAFFVVHCAPDCLCFQRICLFPTDWWSMLFLGIYVARLTTTLISRYRQLPFSNAEASRVVSIHVSRWLWTSVNNGVFASGTHVVFWLESLISNCSCPLMLTMRISSHSLSSFSDSYSTLSALFV